jgi:hypothetical protein
MDRVLARLSIPPRLRDEMMLKKGSSQGFDVPNTKEGVLFLNRWENSSAQDRDAMMKQAYATDVPIHQVQLKKDEDEDA